MSEKTTFLQEDRPNEISVLQKQLAISLKFHHSKTIRKLPKEIAMQVMREVGYSCHPEVTNQVQNSVIRDDVPVTKERTIYL